MAEQRFPSSAMQPDGRFTVTGSRTGSSGKLLLLLAIIFLFCGSQARSGPQDRLDIEAGKLKELRTHIDRLRQQLESVRGKHDAQQAALERTDKAIGKIRNDMRALEQESAAADTRLAALQQQRDEARRKLVSMRGMLRRELRASWISGRQQRIKLLLNQEDPAGIARILGYQGYFTRVHARRMQQFDATLQDLKDASREVSAQQTRIASLHEEYEGQATQLAREQENQRKQVDALQQQLQSGTSRLSQLRRDEQRVNQLVTSLQQVMRDIPPGQGSRKGIAELRGQLHWPVSGRISLPFGARLASGQSRSNGIHISAPAGAEVRAVARGRVAFADWLRGFGLLIIIDHGHGYMTLYGENSSLYKSVGDWVEQGEVISAAGSSGGQQRSGIYMELRKNGQPIDPTAWFKGKPGLQQAVR